MSGSPSLSAECSCFVLHVNPALDEWEALGEVVSAFCDARHGLAGVSAVTLAGIVTKAKIARLDPNDDFDTYSLADLANSIVDDLIAMEGRS